jgi:hypothetical protein
MKLLRQLPFETEYDDDDRLDCGVWRSDKNICEYKSDEAGICDPSGMYYGTLDPREPHFCARHFNQNVAKGDSEAPYALIDRR